jgi:5-methylcytosine-specific restriction endonuclease McrA
MGNKVVGFLASTAWAKIRVDLYTIRGKRCESCGSTRSIQVHHLTYDRYGGNEEPGDLVILCGNCHMTEHGLKKPKRIKKKRAKKKKAPKFRREFSTMAITRQKISIEALREKSRAMDIKQA